MRVSLRVSMPAIATTLCRVRNSPRASLVRQLLASGDVSLVFDFDRIPKVRGSLRAAREGYAAGLARKNLESVRSLDAPDLSDADLILCSDAQTNGPLLLTVRPDALGLVGAAFRSLGARAWQVGNVVEQRAAEPLIVIKK